MKKLTINNLKEMMFVEDFDLKISRHNEKLQCLIIGKKPALLLGLSLALVNITKGELDIEELKLYYDLAKKLDN